MTYQLNAVGEYVAALPETFIMDCLECGCDIGLYTSNNVWVGNQQHLEELISRARFYADGGTDYKEMNRAAKNLLKVLSQEGLFCSM